MRRFLFMLILFLAALPWRLDSASTLPLSFRSIVLAADRIFVGRCLETSRELDERGFPSRVVRMQVIEPILGLAPFSVSVGSLLFKEYGNGSFHCDPSVNQLLFLYPESEYGFTSPVGLGQGLLTLVQDDSGERGITSPFPHLAVELGEKNFNEVLALIRRYLSR